jgi:hypothetical protein
LPASSVASTRTSMGLRCRVLHQPRPLRTGSGIAMTESGAPRRRIDAGEPFRPTADSGAPARAHDDQGCQS